MQDELKYSWDEIEAVIDHLLSETSLSAGLPHPHPTLKNLRADQLARYRLTSTQYLENLGINTVLKLKKDNGQYNYGDTAITNLTKKEEMLLDLLFAKQGLTVSYEEIASVLWPKDDNWSLYALAKEIQRLRDKIKISGINTRLILAHRKLGYSLS
jgi:DNA-binding response OmpR family regulator